MHIDQDKRFDKRSVDQAIREGLMSQKEYQDYLANLPDVSDKVYDGQDRSAGEEDKTKKD